MDALPVPYFQDVYRDTKYFVLRLLGRNSNAAAVLLATLVVSCGAAVAEEVFFRGFCFNAFAGYFDPWVALISSSALFGLAHFPVFGANAALESILGGVMGFAYMQSGYNLAVPIMIHCLYDFITIFRTWTVASKDLKERLLEATEYQISRETIKEPSKVKVLSKAVSVSRTI
jgi:membrane protease YdiL (CAAX protease family)